MARRAAEPLTGALAGPRVVLRPAAGDDLPTIERWYPEAVAASMGLSRGDAPGTQNLHFELEAARAAAPDGALLVIARADDPAPVGLLDYRANSPGPRWLTVAFIALARGRRGWGLGSEAMRLLEAEAARRFGSRRFLAGVDPRNGLGLYFWLRLGYRPARLDDGLPPPRAGAFAMVRAVAPR